MTALRSAPDFANLAGLGAEDHHHWEALPPVYLWLMQNIADGDKVLEVGPGKAPFPRADVFVDIADLSTIKGVTPEIAARSHVVDTNRERLPFADKEFDFVYCRHTLEDMWNPFLLCREMSRVGRGGYIETPSPMAELCRGIDGKCQGGNFDGRHPPWRGYYHHHWIVWEAGGTLNFVRKFPMVEAFEIDNIEFQLRSGGAYWNSYYLWEDAIKLHHWQMPVDVDMLGYPHLLSDACREATLGATRLFAFLKQYFEQKDAAVKVA